MYYYKLYYKNNTFYKLSKKVTDYYDVIKLPKPKNKISFIDEDEEYIADVIYSCDHNTITELGIYISELKYLKRISKSDAFLESI